MTDDDLKQYKESLLALQDTIKAGLAHKDPANDSISPDNAIGRLTRMEAIQAQQISSAGREQMKIRLKRVQRALKQIEMGSYGLCARCNASIPEGRLAVMPEAPFCMNCATR